MYFSLKAFQASELFSHLDTLNPVTKPCRFLLFYPCKRNFVDHIIVVDKDSGKDREGVELRNRIEDSRHLDNACENCKLLLGTFGPSIVTILFKLTVYFA